MRVWFLAFLVLLASCSSDPELDVYGMPDFDSVVSVDLIAHKDYSAGKAILGAGAEEWFQNKGAWLRGPIRLVSAQVVPGKHVSLKRSPEKGTIKFIAITYSDHAYFIEDSAGVTSLYVSRDGVLVN